LHLLCACLAVVGGVSAPRAATAHPEFSPSAVNRYCKLTLVEPRAIRLAYTVMIGADPALATRKLADANADGRIDEAESRALASRLRAAVEAGLTVELDGVRVTPAFEEPSVGMAGAEVAPSPLSVDLIARLPIGDGAAPHRLRIEDAVELAPPGEAEVRIEESPSVRLLASGRGRDLPVAADPAAKRETRFVWSGPPRSALEDRSVSLRFVAAGAPSTPRPLAMVIAAGVAGFVVVGGVVVLLVLRRRRRSATAR